MTQRKQGPGRVPDYLLSAMNKQTDYKGSCGAGWRNDDGSISIKLAPWVVLEGKDELVIRLFPNTDGSRRLPVAEVGEPMKGDREAPY